MTSTLPSALGLSGPPFRTVVTLGTGPRRVTDDHETPRFHVVTGPKSPSRPRRRVNLAACRNILVVKLDFIGDHVLTIPFLANLRRNAPRAKITLVVLDRVYPFATFSRIVDRVVTVSSAEGRRITFGAASVAVLSGFRRDYTGRRFDLALVPRWDVDFNGALQIAVGSRAPRIAGFSERSTAARRLLNRGDDRFYTDLVFDHRSVHEVEHKLALIAALGGAITTRRASLDIRRADKAEADAFLAAAFGPHRRPTLAVAPFVADPKRQYPPERLAQVVRGLRRRFDLDVVLVGGRFDAAAGAAFAEAVGGRAVSSLGRVGPAPSAALVGECLAFIGMDSGPAHLAAAVGTPVAVISCHPQDGPADHVHSPRRFAPWGEPGKVLVLQPNHALPPCRDGCTKDMPHCIGQLTEAEMLSKLT